MSDNPFERYDIDPREGPEAITARMRELVDDADEDERDELRRVWERLTMHPRERLHAALDAFPPLAPLGEPGSMGMPAAPVPSAAAFDDLTLADVARLPSVARCLSAAGASAGERPAKPLAVLPPLSQDPIVDDPS